jgi:hypothetical protein
MGSTANHIGHLGMSQNDNYVTLIIKDDVTAITSQKRLQMIAKVLPFSALSNMHTQIGYASAEATLSFREGDILSAGVDPITRGNIKRVISKCTICVLPAARTNESQ